MTEVTTEQIITPTVQKDEHGIEIVTDFPEPVFPGQQGYETWAFLDTSRDFFARFRRLINVEGTHYAEVDYSSSSNNPTRKVRWVRLTEFTALKKCQPGDDLRCLWLFGKPYVLAERSCERGRKLTEKEWDEMCNHRHFYPEFYNRLVEA